MSHNLDVGYLLPATATDRGRGVSPLGWLPLQFHTLLEQP